MAYHYKAIVLIPVECEVQVVRPFTHAQAMDFFKKQVLAMHPKLKEEQLVINSIEGVLYVEPRGRA